MYFGKEAHEAIVSYQNSTCLKEKENIYHQTIKRSFEKLVEISDPDARKHVYGIPYSEWKEKYQK